ncbi:MAG TPA: RNA polymerase subunit sigma-70, partial [Thermoleophilaceae bacterium]|nr:RNA polymerase subunit sigma-70 [Thermoleophilaceae bacterium]
LTQIQRRPKRVLPIDYGPATDPLTGPSQPITETVWIEPYPDTELEDGLAGPEARYEQREAVELAFIAALQHLPARQRAVLVLREVLGFSAREVAGALGTTVASVNSALQRARKTVEERLPARSQQATLRSLGDDGLSEIVDRYVEAWEQNDFETVVSMLAEDATFAMPPLATWFGGTDEIGTFLEGWPLSGAWRWRPLRTTANGQPALAFYAWDDDERAYLPFALNVLTFRGEQISDVVAFVVRATDIPATESYGRWVDEPMDSNRLYASFERFGLPDRLEESR